MIDSNFLNYSCLEPLNVSRETFPELEQFRQTIIEKNKDINLISKATEETSKERHIIDSAQIIDLIDLIRIAETRKSPILSVLKIKHLFTFKVI